MAPVDSRFVIFRKLKVLRRKRQENKQKMHKMRQMAQLLMDQRRRLKLLCMVLLLLTLRKCVTEPVVRTIRRDVRNTGWWSKVRDSYSDARFKRTLRVSRKTFDYILKAIRDDLERQTIAEDPIPPDARLAVCLYRLARGDYFYTIAEMTGYGEATVCQITYNVSCIIVHRLWGLHVSNIMPTTPAQYIERIVDQECEWQFPCAWSAVDGCHIPIRQPGGGLAAAKEYHNFKNFYSIVLMAIVDTKYRFVWANCGHPGNTHDAMILKSSKIWEQLLNGDTIPSIGKQIGGNNVPPLILGDSAFPLKPFLMKPYTNATLSEKQHYYNYRLSRSRMVIEGAFGQLKGRWRVLMRKGETHQDTAKAAALASVVLHNICMDKRDSISKNLDLNYDPKTKQRRSREEVRNLLHMTQCEKIVDKGMVARRIRDSLCDKVWTEKQTGQVS